MRAIRLAWLALLCLPTLLLAQRLSVPPGRRHFVVLVDSSHSMVADSRPRNAKRQALNEAENALGRMLYSDGWYRPGKDLITVVQYGFGTTGAANQAYKRLHGASLGDDYTRRIVGHDSNLSAANFKTALRPRARTQLNVLAWAMPMGLAAAAPPPGTDIQETFVIMLNDAQMNEGSILLEKVTLGKHLNPTARQRLQASERKLADLVRLTDADGQPGAYKQLSFGPEADPIVITIFKAISRSSAAGAEKLKGLDPLDGVDVDWNGLSTLEVSFAAPNEIRGRKAKVRIDGQVGHASGEAELGMGSRGSIAGVSVNGAGTPAHLSLLVEGRSQNELLGSQVYNAVFEREVLVPDSPFAASRIGRTILIILGLGLIGTGIWAWYQRNVARHFKFWLPDYALPGVLPALSQEAGSHFTSRVPRYDGDEAAWLELPHPWIRSLFYRGATVQWDDRLEVQGFAGATEAPIGRLPRFVSFQWAGRPSSGGEYDVIISRPASKQRNQRMKATVRFLALPLPETTEPTDQ